MEHCFCYPFLGGNPSYFRATLDIICVSVTGPLALDRPAFYYLVGSWSGVSYLGFCFKTDRIHLVCFCYLLSNVFVLVTHWLLTGVGFSSQWRGVLGFSWMVPCVGHFGNVIVGWVFDFWITVGFVGAFCLS